MGLILCIFCMLTGFLSEIHGNMILNKGKNKMRFIEKKKVRVGKVKKD